MKKLSKLVLLIACIASSAFSIENLSIGGRASGNFNLIWGENSRDGAYGFGFNLGGAALYEINSMIQINPELTFAYRNHSFSSEVDLSLVTSSADITITFLNIDIPILARLQVIQPVFFEIGPLVSLNLSSSYSYEQKSSSSLTFTNEGDIEEPSLIEFGLVFGVGKKLDIGTGLDVNFRFILGLTNTYKDSLDNNIYQVITGTTDRDNKSMMFQLGATYWFL